MMNKENISRKLNLAKIFVTNINPDYVYNGKVFSWKLNAMLPKSRVSIEICERNKTYEIEHIAGNIIYACLYISKAQFTTETSGIKGKYIGKHSPTIFFSELLDIEYLIESGGDEPEVTTDLLEETAAAIFERKWNGAFGIGLYSEVHMFETTDGVFVLTDKLFSLSDLKLESNYYMVVEEAFINSYSIVK